MFQYLTLSFLSLCLFPAASAAGDADPQNIVYLCNEIQCPNVPCEQPVKLDGECCPFCIQPEISAGRGHCMYKGTVLDDGETFYPAPSNQSSNETADLYCNECTCTDGSIVCKDMTEDCPPSVQCDEPILPEGGCCPSCPTPDTPQGCSDIDGRKFTNGDTWHPSLPPFGIIPCLNCTCVDSQEECFKTPCSEGPLPVCNPDDPVETVTLCCPKCVPPATSNTNAATPAIPSTPSTATPPTASPPDLRPPCSDSSYIVRAWRHRRENVDEMAIEIMDGRANVTIYKWAWHEDSYVKEEMVVSAGSFRRGTYNFLGLAKIRRTNALRNRASKRERIEACTADCANLVAKLLRPVDCEPISLKLAS